MLLEMPMFGGCLHHHFHLLWKWQQYGPNEFAHIDTT